MAHTNEEFIQYVKDVMYLATKNIVVQDCANPHMKMSTMSVSLTAARHRNQHHTFRR